MGSDLEQFPAEHSMTNPEIADKLLALAHVLASQKENPFKIKAFRRAARVVRAMGDSVADQVASGQDLTRHPGIGPAIAAAIEEITRTGTTRRQQDLATESRPELLAAAAYPRLDPKRVQRIFKKLNISTVDEMKERLESGEIREQLGAPIDQHVRRALVSDGEQLLLNEAEDLVRAVEKYLVDRCGAVRVQVAGEYRRRVEIVRELSFVVETPALTAVVETMKSFGGRTNLVEADAHRAAFILPSGVRLQLAAADSHHWGVALIQATGSEEHLQTLRETGADIDQLWRSDEDLSTEEAVYRKLELSFIPQELREGRDEVSLAKRGQLQELVAVEDFRGELHAHTTSSDGVDTLEDMAEGARQRGLEYIGITDHSQSLKIARGLSEQRLRNQLRFIDKLNSRLNGIRILKAAEVDILVDGSLDYPDDLLKELDYTICSVHSKFRLNKVEQTERIMRAMDNPYFTFLGHATGRLLLRRSGYELDMERLVEHARQTGCFFELNSNPNRLDLSAENARMAREGGVRIIVNTDAHSTRELAYLRYGVDQARRAGFDKASVLNTLPWEELRRLTRR